MAATAKLLVGGLKNIGSKIAGSMVGQAAKKVAGSKFGQAVSGFVKDKATSVRNFANNSTLIQNARSGVNNFMTNTKVGQKLTKAGTTIKTAYEKADPKKSLLYRAGNAIAQDARTAAGYLKKVDWEKTGKVAMTAASVGVGYSQVISSNKQYKDSVARTDAYNAALKAEEDAATAAKNKADAEYNSRADAYTLALSTSQTSTSNIYSDGYAGDSIFSSTLKNPKYSIL